MKSNRTDAAREHFANLADLYIGYQMEEALDNDRSRSRAYFNAHHTFAMNRECGGLDWNYATGNWNAVVDSHDVTEALDAMSKAAYRAEEYRVHRAWLSRRAKERLAARLKDNRSHRRFACDGVCTDIFLARQRYNLAIKALIKEARKVAQGGNVHHMHDWWFTVLSGSNEHASTCSNAWLASNNYTPRAADRIQAKFSAGTDMYNALNDVIEAYERHMCKFRERTYGEQPAWTTPKWAEQGFFSGSKYAHTHFLHLAESDPTKVAYTQSGSKLVRDIQTILTPGRYLQKFFGGMLTSDQIRAIAESQVEETKPIELTFFSNTEPDMWYWAYENGRGYSSCMVYDRDSRYLDYSLSDPMDHPARIYCHPENDLALAVIARGGKPGAPGSYNVARCIVNTRTKKWLRIYGDDRIIRALEQQGYYHDTECTKGQLLVRREAPNGGFIMPYLDGCYTNVSTKADSKGNLCWVIVACGVDAQCSEGIIDGDDMEECACCGGSFDGDDMTTVRDGDQVCDHCLENHYTEVQFRNTREYVGDGDLDSYIYCESDGWYYSESGAEYHDIRYVESREAYYSDGDVVLAEYGDHEGEWIHYDDAKELPDGKYCHEDDYDEVMESDFSDDTEDDTEDSQVAAPAPAPTTATFKPGDTVRIVRAVPDYAYSWVDRFNEYKRDGDVLTITRVFTNEHGAHVKIVNGWTLPVECLELVTQSELCEAA